MDELLKEATGRAAAGFADPRAFQGSGAWVDEVLDDVEPRPVAMPSRVAESDDAHPKARPELPVALTIVIPAYNEARRLGPGLDRLKESIGTGAFDVSSTEIIVVNDGSTDLTGAIAQDLLQHYPYHRVLTLPENSGKGAAIRAGIAAARGHTIAFMDSDMGTDPIDLPTLLSALLTADIAIGSRSDPASHVERKYFNRKLMGVAWSGLVNSITDVSIRDTQCGFKAFRAPVARLLFHYATTDGFAFDVEVLMIARHFGLDVAEIPVNWTLIEGSRIRPLVDPLLMVIDVIRSRLGLSRLPAVSAISVSVASDPSATEAADLVAESAGPMFPILREEGDRFLVLLPLCGSAEIEEVSRRLAAIPGSQLTRVSVPVATVIHHLSA